MEASWDIGSDGYLEKPKWDVGCDDLEKPKWDVGCDDLEKPKWDVDLMIQKSRLIKVNCQIFFFQKHLFFPSSHSYSSPSFSDSMNEMSEFSSSTSNWANEFVNDSLPSRSRDPVLLFNKI
jgi:hypothetical protein